MKKSKFLYLLPLLGLVLAGCENNKNNEQPADQQQADQGGNQSGDQGGQQQGGDNGQSQGGGDNGQSQVVVSSIAVKAGSVKTEYFVNDEFEVAGGKIVVTYSDETTTEVDMTLDMVPVKPDMTQAAENVKVDVSYLEKTTSYYINISAPTVASISITTSPKVDYFVGDEFEVTGGVLQVNMSDNTRQSVNMTLAMIDNAPDMSVAHENYQVNVTYEGAHTSYVINVVAQDLRTEVSIGISYEYNMGPVTEITDFSQELVFTAGKEYKFHYGANPNAAKDSLVRKYLTRAGDVLDDKPTAVGEYTYKIELEEGDENYKPAVKTVNYKIVAPVIRNFLLNNANAPELTNEAGNATKEVEGITVNFKNAKAADDALATLVKQADAGAVAGADDNFIEIASPVAVTNALTVEFPAVLNNYVRVYGSYDGEHFLQLDTLNRVRQTTTKANGYYFFRFVNSSLGSNELTISSISFSFEQDGAPESVLSKAESSDMFNGATYAEEGAFWHSEEEVFDANYSSKSIKFVNYDMHAHIDFGFGIEGYELWNYTLVFKVKPSDNATYQKTKTDTTPYDTNPVYVRFMSGNTKLGSNTNVYEIPTGTEGAEWHELAINIGEYYDDGATVDGININVHRYCATGAVYMDDFRIVQSSSYPRTPSISALYVNNVQTTEFEVDDAFVFDGEVSGLFSDGFTGPIANDDPNLSITEPDMTSSGTKEVTVSYTFGGKTRSVKYQITVNPKAGVNPKDEETQAIVAEANDLAKASKQAHDGNAKDVGVVEDNTVYTYGNSTNSIKATNLPAAENYFMLSLNSAIDADKIKVKFFMKDYPTDKVYVALADSTYTEIKKDDGSTKQRIKTDKFTKTDAGNSWKMFEYTFETKTAGGDGASYIKFIISSAKLAEDEYLIFDGIEVSAVS